MKQYLTQEMNFFMYELFKRLRRKAEKNLLALTSFSGHTRQDAESIRT